MEGTYTLGNGRDTEREAADVDFCLSCVYWAGAGELSHGASAAGDRDALRKRRNGERLADERCFVLHGSGLGSADGSHCVWCSAVDRDVAAVLGEFTE